MPDLPKFVWVLFGCLPQFQRTESRWYWHSLDGGWANVARKNWYLRGVPGIRGHRIPGWKASLKIMTCINETQNKIFYSYYKYPVNDDAQWWISLSRGQKKTRRNAWFFYVTRTRIELVIPP